MVMMKIGLGMDEKRIIAEFSMFLALKYHDLFSFNFFLFSSWL